MGDTLGCPVITGWVDGGVPVGVGAKVGSEAGPGGCQVGAVVVGEEASSNKIGL